MKKKMEYKYPQIYTCSKCKWFVKNCTKYPEEDWADIWLTNQCKEFELLGEPR